MITQVIETQAEPPAIAHLVQTHTDVQLGAQIHPADARVRNVPRERAVPVGDRRCILCTCEERVRSVCKMLMEVVVVTMTTAHRGEPYPTMMIHRRHPSTRIGLGTGSLPRCSPLGGDQVTPLDTLTEQLGPHSLLHAGGFLHEERSILDGRGYYERRGRIEHRSDRSDGRCDKGAIKERTVRVRLQRGRGSRLRGSSLDDVP
jgi:hypothetical protein